MIGLLIISLTIGLSYILVGLLVKKKPTSINGFNRLDEHHRKTYPLFLQKLMTIAGITTVIGCVIFVLLKWYIGIIIFLFLPSFIMVFILLLKEKKINHKKSTNILIVFFIALTIILSFSLVYSSKEHSIYFESEGIKIIGLYGENISFNSISNITLTNNLPTIRLRTNGLGLGAIRKGYFLTKEKGTVKLFLTSTSAPYIQMQTISGEYIFINFRDANKTIENYNKIKSSL